MATIDPGSPRQRGRDSGGHPRELGDRDSDGYLVGWVESDGLCWESRRECEVARASGSYADAWSRWNRTGGVLGVEPDPAEFVARWCSPDTEDEALAECHEAIEFVRWGVGARALMAARN